jgi:tetrahydromethanopterin S-methyltransferase subunit G
MSVISDVRGLLQEMVAPDLKAGLAKLDAVDKKIDGVEKNIYARIDGVEKKIDATASAMEQLASARHNELLAKLETYDAKHVGRYDTIMKSLEVDQRLQALERKREPAKKVTGYVSSLEEEPEAAVEPRRGRKSA